jgi:hypothetical protein
LVAIASRRHRLTAHCNCSTVPPPIALQALPIAAAAIHCNHTAAIHCDCRCHPSCVASNCAASALVAIVRRPLCHPLCHRHPVAHRNCFSVPLPIAPPLLPIAAAAVHCDLAAAVHHDCPCHPSHIAPHCTASALAAIVHHLLCHPLCHHCPITHRPLLCCPAAHCAALPIATATVHHNLTAVVHCDCLCCPP